MSCLLSHASIYSDFFVGMFNAKACPKMTGEFSFRYKATFYLIEEGNFSNSKISRIRVAFHQKKKKKKNSALKHLSFSHHQSFHSAILRTPQEQISQHLSKLLWLVETGSRGGREALLLPQATADKKQGVQTHHLRIMSRSTAYKSHSHCATFTGCFYPHWSTLHVQQIFPLLPLKLPGCCLQL